VRPGTRGQPELGDLLGVRAIARSRCRPHVRQRAGSSALSPVAARQQSW
jgi:hypothetical protein